jgi:hypothetical protein
MVLLVALVLFVDAERRVVAQSNDFVLETEQHWDTYGVGGTCISGSNNLAVADIDGDGVKEMVTGGSSYYLLPDGSRTTRSAPLKIWNWNGKNLRLEKSYNWTGNIGCVCAGDVGGDGKTELITAGSIINGTGSYPSLRIWRWDGENLVLRGNYEGKILGSVYIGELNANGKPEIFTAGRSSNDPQSSAQLSIFRWNGNSLTLSSSVDWGTTNNSRANSVYACDLNNDGLMEIVTAGYSNNLNNSRGQLRVWQFDGTNLTLKSNEEWCMIDGAYSVDVAGNVMGNTIASNVKVADVDGDGEPEIVTSGFTYNGSETEGQLRIWNWSGGVLNLEKSHEWAKLDITQPNSISINDVDGDGKKEIVTSGVTTKYGNWTNETNKERAELKVWRWDGNTLTLKQSTDWSIGDGVAAWNDGTGDVDNDGIVEIRTVGCMYNGTLCDPDLRIWSLPVASETQATSPYLPLAVVGAVVTAVVITTVAFMLMKKMRK